MMIDESVHRIQCFKSGGKNWSVHEKIWLEKKNEDWSRLLVTRRKPKQSFQWGRIHLHDVSLNERIAKFALIKCIWLSWMSLIHGHCIDSFVNRHMNLLRLQLSVACWRNFLSPDWDPPAICLISLENPLVPNWQDRSCRVLGPGKQIESQYFG